MIIYIRSKKGQTHAINISEQEIKDCVDIIKYKKLSYINNRVILPRAEYRLQTTHVPESTAKNMHRPFLSILKNKLKLNSRINNNILHHTGLVGATPLHQALFIARSSAFTTRLNERSWSEISTRIRLRYAQLKLGLTECILTCSPSLIVYQRLTNNFNFQTLKNMRDQLIDFTTPTDVLENWTISSGSVSILETLKSHRIISNVNLIPDETKVLASFYNRNPFHLSLLSVDQLLTNSALTCYNGINIKKSTI